MSTQEEHLVRDPCVAELAPSTLQGRQFVFIVGAPRSGTTWLQRLIAFHPLVKTGQESHVFSQYLAPQIHQWRKSLAESRDPNQLGRNGIGLGGYLKEEDFLEVLRGYLVKMLQPVQLRTDELFLEKSPTHSLVVPEIKTLLPESRIIHIVRDPRDVVTSLLAAKRSWGKNWAPGRVWSAAQMWAQYVHAVEQAAQDFSEEEFMEVQYESLKRSPVAVLRKVVRFLSLEWSDDDVRRALKENTPAALEEGRGTDIPVYGEHRNVSGRVVEEPEGFVRKAKTGSGMEELSLLQQLLVDFFTRPLAEKKGYAGTWKKWAEAGDRR